MPSARTVRFNPRAVPRAIFKSVVRSQGPKYASQEKQL